jgi:ribosomal protein L11 methyltransferase
MQPSPFSHRPARTWQRVVLEVDPEMTDAVTTFLTGLTGSGIELSSSDLPTGQPGLPDNAMEKITGYIICDEKNKATELEQLRTFLGKLHTFFPDCPAPRITVDFMQEEDWGKSWKEFFTAYQITPRLVIKPSWEKPDLQHDSGQTSVTTIEMDPGLAFGTGHHASTQLALTLIDQLCQSKGTQPQKVLDVGTGSGILAMACALFGAREVLAIDNDPDAVQTARNNIAINKLESIITVSAVDVSAVQPAYDLIAANITHDTLAKLAPALVQLLATKGHLVLAGILKDPQENSIVSIYTGLGLTHLLTEAKEEWVALKFMKP